MPDPQDRRIVQTRRHAQRVRTVFALEGEDAVKRLYSTAQPVLEVEPSLQQRPELGHTASERLWWTQTSAPALAGNRAHVGLHNPAPVAGLSPMVLVCQTWYLQDGAAVPVEQDWLVSIDVNGVSTGGVVVAFRDSRGPAILRAQSVQFNQVGLLGGLAYRIRVPAAGRLVESIPFVVKPGHTVLFALNIDNNATRASFSGYLRPAETGEE